MTQNPYDKMRQNAILTMPPEELTLMLYDGALKFCNQAILAVEGKEYEKANNLIQRVQDIIREFQMTLDMEYEISGQFNMMYEYMHDRLVDANLQKDVGILEEVRGYVREFRDTWKETVRLARAQPAGAKT